MKNGIMVTVLLLTGMALMCKANTNQVDKVKSVALMQNETAVDHMKIKNPEIKELLKDVYQKMKVSDEEIQAFAKRKSSQKVKEGFWTVTEMRETNSVVVFMRADFFSETGPIRSGGKVVYKDNTHQEELINQRYKLNYYENGKIELFRTAGEPAITIQFYPSGRVKQFCLSAHDNTTIAAFDGDDDDSIKHEVYSGRKVDKDKGKPCMVK